MGNRKTPRDKSESRPDSKSISSGAELRRWYWRKDELLALARHHGLKTTSGKFRILDRIAHFLDTGKKHFPADETQKPRSKFDWHSEQLSRATIITDSYRNTQNVRRFFKAELGDAFRFNIAFMEWMKANTGKTLGEACAAWQAQRDEANQPGSQTRIKDHNQFNQYTRDFLADNPELGMEDVRRVWALKIRQPSDTGRHVYEPSDLQLDD